MFFLVLFAVAIPYNDLIWEEVGPNIELMGCYAQKRDLYDE